jgi:membrane protease YdiL (CAAX protease family)
MEEIVNIQAQLEEKWVVFWWSLGIGLIALGIAWRQGLFKSFLSSKLPIIRGIDVLKGFVYFLFAELFFIPALIGMIFALSGKGFEHIFQLNQQEKNWVNLCIMLGGFGGAYLAYFELKSEQRQQLWQQTSQTWTQNFGVGVAVWFLIYPLVLAFNQLISIAAWHLFHHSFVEQIVVQHLRDTLASPWIFGATALSVITLVPMTEEFLFRGLLQSWLKRKLHNTSAAIIFSSIVFAIFHYSNAQGVTNIELLSSLFLLSCMLGFIYERQRSLWAPIGLHSFFNLMSLLMIFKET